MTQLKYIVGNWKMYGSADLLETVIGASVSGSSRAHVVICPPATLLSRACGLCSGKNIAVGGQDCHTAKEGAYTGDISAHMLKEIGCRYVIVGHSERRQQHKETNGMIKAKAAAAIAAGLIPIVCIGETEAERQAGKAEDVVTRQIMESLPTSHFLLAYEPVWAIGSGQTPTIDDIRAMHRHIASLKPGVGVLYGGSVKAANAKEILALPEVSGVLVGGASLKADEFCKIIECGV